MCPGSLGCGVSGLFSSIFSPYPYKQKKLTEKMVRVLKVDIDYLGEKSQQKGDRIIY